MPHHTSSVLSSRRLSDAYQENCGATVTNDKKLPKVNLLWPLSKKSVSDNLPALLVNHRLILARKPAAHPLLKLCNCHTVAMPLVTNQLVIQLRQQ